MIPIEAMQDAIYTRLTSHAAMSAYPDVVDNQQADTPLTRIGLEWTLTNAQTFDEEYFYEGTYTIRTYSDAADRGGKRVGSMQSAIHEALTSSDLSVTGWTVQVFHIQNVATLQSINPLTGEEERVGILTYRTIIHQA